MNQKLNIDTDSLVFSAHRNGKIKSVPVRSIDSEEILQRVYTPGVASVCTAIQQKSSLVQLYTALNKTVAIVTNGTAVLGLGDIGVHASLPVMEGKAALFSELVGLNGVPILIDSKNVNDIVQTVQHISPSFGAILLEDIAAPECFEIEARLKKSLKVPVLHDDQHGTAVVTLAALLNACELSNRDLKTATVGHIGLGAAGIGIASLLGRYGIENRLGCDINDDAKARFESLGGRCENIEGVMAQSDIIVATTGVQGLIKPEWIRPNQIILALTNPAPEIEPSVAMKAGASFAADGKSVNNVLGFPALFRGILEMKANAFQSAHLIAAAKAIAALAPSGSLVPHALDKGVHNKVVQAVREATES